VGREAFDRLWRAAIAEVRDHGCVRGRNGHESTITLKNLADKRAFTCVDLAPRWRPITSSLEGTVGGTPPAGSDADIVWPFTPDYWKDEIRYAGRTTRDR
jgi:hypothetical protein